MKKWKSPTTIIALLALFVALGGGAALASGVISGQSIENHSIPLRKLTPGTIHMLREHRGPKGDTGLQGPAGDTGGTGAQGPAGAQGPTGAEGPGGPQGPVGPVGPTGAQGPQGDSGPQGPSGPLGPTGPSGPQGVAGPSGPSGPQGVSGPSGPSGPQGDSGPDDIPVYNTGGTLQTSQHAVTGTFTMANTNGPSAVTLSGSAAFTSASSYVCTITDYTNADAYAKLVRTSGTAFTLTTFGGSAKNDAIGFICIGT